MCLALPLPLALRLAVPLPLTLPLPLALPLLLPLPLFLSLAVPLCSRTRPIATTKSDWCCFAGQLEATEVSSISRRDAATPLQHSHGVLVSRDNKEISNGRFGRQWSPETWYFARCPPLYQREPSSAAQKWGFAGSRVHRPQSVDAEPALLKWIHEGMQEVATAESAIMSAWSQAGYNQCWDPGVLHFACCI